MGASDMTHTIGNEQQNLKLEHLARLVEAKSKEFNITSIKDYDSIWQKHVLDSLELLKLQPFLGAAPKKVLDIGTGAGFPGLPLAIAKPEWQFTLLDSTKKKVDVVAEFVRELELGNVDTKWGRAEEISPDLYDLVIARAVSYLPDLLSLCNPLLSQNGFIASYKSYSPKELAAGLKIASNIDLSLVKEHRYQLGDNERVIWLFRKGV